ncbi:SPFH/Band 7/PHB domain protein [Cardiobacteriaceae bacterium TAE3-ERU3]|nr:SPFH/Band 7/PHB domain protein [Cardiobacteriaceae bacterium TAE3-ERU3]
MQDLLGGAEIGFPIFVIIIVFLVFWLGKKAIQIVSQGMEYTVLRFGKYNRTLEPGFHILVPFYEKIGHKINMKERVLDVPRQEVITLDNAIVSVDGVVFFQVMDAAKAAYAVDELEYAILNLSMTNLRTVMGSMALDDLLSKRDDINIRLLSTIDHATNPWGVKVTRVEIKDISPPIELAEAMARQMKAERIKRAEILEAEGRRQSEILAAEGEKQSEILQAEGRKAAAFLDAEARERMAQAEARATAMVSRAIAEGDMNAINYFVAQKYVEALGKFADSDQQKTFFMPMESNGILGALGGMAEMLKQASKEDKS